MTKEEATKMGELLQRFMEKKGRPPTKTEMERLRDRALMRGSRRHGR